MRDFLCQLKQTVPVPHFSMARDPMTHELKYEVRYFKGGERTGLVTPENTVQGALAMAQSAGADAVYMVYAEADASASAGARAGAKPKGFFIRRGRKSWMQIDPAALRGGTDQ